MIAGVPVRLVGAWRRHARLTLWPVTAAAVVATLALARSHPTDSFAGTSFAGSAIEAGAALAVAVAGLLFWGSRSRNPVGPLLVCVSFAWLLPEWANPEAGFAPLFTLGLVGAFACVPFVVHGALLYPSGRVPGRGGAAVVALAYVGGIGLVGLVPSLFFDPRAGGCGVCPSNLVLVHGDASLSEQLTRWAIGITIGWTILAALALAVRLVRSSPPARRAAAPVLVAAIAYLGLANAVLWHSVGRGFLSNDATSVHLWRAQGVALVLLGVAVLWGLLRARRTRTSVAQLVVELGHAPRAGGAQAMLAGALGDPELQLVYRRAEGDGYVDVDGRPSSATVGAGRAVTPLVRAGRELAVVVHDERLVADTGLVEDAIATARLAVENEQLQAEARAQMNEIRASRARIVEAGDHERRRLERDLHDGAQQRLVGLSLALRLLRNEAERAGASDALPLLDEADRELRQALAALREVAHGIHPAVLTDEGLAAALETLSERLPRTLRLGHVPDERYAAPIEAAAYFAAAELVRDLSDGEGSASVDVARREGMLIVDVERLGRMAEAHERIVEISDRVGALDGELDVSGGPNGRVRMRARIPCA
jgi:signal transduction histidine kinase